MHISIPFEDEQWISPTRKKHISFFKNGGCAVFGVNSDPPRRYKRRRSTLRVHELRCVGRGLKRPLLLEYQRDRQLDSVRRAGQNDRLGRVRDLDRPGKNARRGHRDRLGQGRRNVLRGECCLVTPSLPRVINFKFPLQPHQKYNITQYEELGLSKFPLMKYD